MGRNMVLAAALAGLAGCAAQPGDGCNPTETLVNLDGEIFVMIDDCGEGTIRTIPATPADLARLEAPL